MSEQLDILLGTVLNSEIDFSELMTNKSDRIYHYTSQEAMLAIIGYNSFYASNIRFLNDTSELIYGKNLIKRIIRRLLEDEEYKFDRENFTDKGVYLLKEMLIAIEKQSITDLYVLCFSRSKDLLSQWRGYATNGVLIELDSEELFSSFEGNYLMRDIIYDIKKQESKIIEEIRILIMYAVYGSEDLFELSSDDLNEFPSSASRVLLNSTVWFKDSCWKEEKEFRLVYNAKSPVFNHKNLDIKYRSNCNFIVPYVELKSKKLPLKGLMVSPDLNQEKLYDGLNHFIRECNIDVEIEKSKIPFL